MAIASADYPQPVQVNGFTCRNCTDVDNAKKHVDPAHPKSGPYDVDASTDPSRQNDPRVKAAAAAHAAENPRAPVQASGSLLDIAA